MMQVRPGPSSSSRSFIVWSFVVGAKLDDKDTDGFTALHHAASNGHLYAVQLLLDLGANPMASSRLFHLSC